MHFALRGRNLEITMDEVVTALLGQLPEPIVDHLVEVDKKEFPTKQAFELATGWDRTSFTSVEAIHVMIKLGFDCRISSELLDGSTAWQPEFEEVASATNEEKVQKVQLALDELQEAVTELAHGDLAVEAMVEE